MKCQTALSLYFCVVFVMNTVEYMLNFADGFVFFLFIKDYIKDSKPQRQNAREMVILKH